MVNDLLKNGSGYVDLTAYLAMKNYGIGDKDMEFKKGEIFEYETANGNFRLALIVSADFRCSDRLLNGILLTEEPKGSVNVPINCRGIMYADCGMVSICADSKLGNYIRSITKEEQAAIDEGLAKCLGLESMVIEKEVIKEIVKEVPTESNATDSVSSDVTAEIAQLKAEAKIYKDLYENLLEKALGYGD